MRVNLGLVLGCVLAICLSTAANAEDDPRLAELLQPVIAAHQGTVSVAVKHLKTGATFAHRADDPMSTASLIKFPVMIAGYQQAADGTLDLAKP
ncbi:MAG: serine hydrolase, partial [Candidatus Saccharimonas sp.]|nr:serine hydrolase [Planctomycetaceae bacterium]